MSSSATLPDHFVPTLSGDAVVHRHRYRATPWYIVHDAMTGRSLHLAEGAWRVVNAMDGQRTLGDIHAHLSCADAAASLEDIHAVCTQLLRGGLLRGAGISDAPAAAKRPSRWRQWLASPLSIRLPLVNPQPLLDRYLATLNPLFSGVAFWLWVMTIVSAIALALSHQAALSERLVSTVLSPHGLLLFVSVYIAMKLAHELAHAFSIRAFGGRVSEMGIVFLVFMPLPYVDASSASIFSSKRQRMLVSSAGIMIEALIGAVALAIWVNVEPGIVREICFAAVIIGGVSTLLFNGNPLLRFDGYYVLCDALEIPNLASRSRRYLTYLTQRYVLKMDHTASPAVTASERGWFVAYGVLSSLYRLVILGVIVWFVSREVPLVGYALAGWVLISQLLLPIARGLATVVTHARTAPDKGHVAARLAGLSAAAALVFFVAPFPSWSSAEGVIWMPPDAQIKAAVDGTVEDMLAPESATVRDTQPVLTLRSDRLENDVRYIDKRLVEVQTRLNIALFRDRSKLGSLRDQLQQTRTNLAEARRKVAALTLRAPQSGTLHFVAPRALAGRFVQKGEVLGYVRAEGTPVVRVAVRQTQIERLRQADTTIRVAIPGHISQPVAARLIDEIGAATHTLPSAALGSAGGGRIATRLNGDDQRTAAEDIFVMDVELSSDAPPVAMGTRVYLRFDYPPSPLAHQILRGLRQLTLGTTRA